MSNEQTRYQILEGKIIFEFKCPDCRQEIHKSVEWLIDNRTLSCLNGHVRSFDPKMTQAFISISQQFENARRQTEDAHVITSNNGVSD